MNEKVGARVFFYFAWIVSVPSCFPVHILWPKHVNQFKRKDFGKGSKFKYWLLPLWVM